jgi:hypothetical protein
MKSILLALVAALSLLAGVAWAFDNVGRQTRDTGMMHAIGISSERIDGNSSLRPWIEVMFGSSEHEVFAAGGSFIDNNDTTTYGVKAGGDYLYRIPAGRRSTFGPIVGAEGRWFRRQGFERWSALNLRFGVQLLFHDAITREERASPTAPLRSWFRAEAGVLVPAMLNRRVDGNTSNFAGSRPSFYGEAGPVLGAFRPVVYYEGLRFSNSPKISGDTVGVRLGWAF